MKDRGGNGKRNPTHCDTETNRADFRVQLTRTRLGPDCRNNLPSNRELPTQKEILIFLLNFSCSHICVTWKVTHAGNRERSRYHK